MKKMGFSSVFGLLALTFLMQTAIGTSVEQSKLQRGAKLFMNYCSGCHSLIYLRYNRLAEDLGLINQKGQINNVLFTDAKITDPIKTSMPESNTREWFGMQPPDLSLIAREKGAEWIYLYLQSFYTDKSRPFGANNRLEPNTAMPNVLYPLSLEKRSNPKEFQELLNDLVAFLVYVGEPTKHLRFRMGWPVVIFFTLFSLVVYRLKKLYWKRVD